MRLSPLPLLMVLLIANPSVAVGQGADPPSGRAAWLRQAGFGVFQHVLPSVEQGPELIRAFDVDALARQLQRAGARYYVLTLGQNSGFFNASNAAYDRIAGHTPGTHCASRDLPLDLWKALQPLGIRLMLYLPCQTPNQDREAQAAFGLSAGPGDRPITPQFAGKWAEVIADWSVRYGDKVSGWWFDGAYEHVGFNDDIARIYADAVHRGNPDAIVAFNPGIKLIRWSKSDDYTAGELNDPFEVLPAGPLVDGAQWHALTFVGSMWGRRDARQPAEKWSGWAAEVAKHGGAITLDVGPNMDPAAGPIGSFDPDQLRTLEAVGRAFGGR